jgi:phosphatidylinositol 4-kinase
VEPDPMKPLLDRMIDMIVASLSGKAKAFYELEFTFFDAVTSISGKLKPYIKKTKPEKKVYQHTLHIKLQLISIRIPG